VILPLRNFVAWNKNLSWLSQCELVDQGLKVKLLDLDWDVVIMSDFINALPKATAANTAEISVQVQLAFGCTSLQHLTPDSFRLVATRDLQKASKLIVHPHVPVALHVHRS
jgi:hypothetical protein